MQTQGLKWLQEHHIRVIDATIPELFTSDHPTMVLTRNMLGAISQFDHSMRVATLKAARERKRACSTKRGLAGTTPSSALRHTSPKSAWLAMADFISCKCAELLT